MLDYHSFIVFLKKKGYHIQHYGDEIVVHLYDSSWTMCRVYLTEGMMSSNEFLSYFKHRFLLKIKDTPNYTRYIYVLQKIL